MNEAVKPVTVKLVTVKLVTVVAEAVLEDYLIGDLKRLGARGYTLSRVEGEGSRGTRVGDVAGGNIRLEVVVGPAVAEAILQHLADTYFAHYAIIAFAADVQVVRGMKYG